MAKRRCAVLALAPLALALSPQARADWKFQPSVEARQTYTDNLRLDRAGFERPAWVAEVTPGFTLVKRGPRLRVNVDYQLHYFTLPSDVDADNTQQRLAATMYAEMIDNLVFFDGSANISQQSVSAFGPSVPYGTSILANRAEVRALRASPYLRHRFGGTATAELRYTRDKVDTGRIGVGNSDGETISMYLASGSNFRQFGWNLVASEQRIDDDFAAETTSRNASLGLRYALNRKLAVTSSVGYDDYDYQALGGRTGGRSWSAGFAWTPSSRTRVEANSGKRFYGNSYFLSANHRTRQTVWSVRYNDAVTTSRSQFVLPSTVDTAALLDRLFAASIADPIARQQAVEAYMRAAGLPPSLADSINYFSNRYFLQKQFQASVALRGSRNQVVFSLFDTRRTALSQVDADSTLLGPNSISLNDATRQSGASALWSRRLNGKTAINATFSANRVESALTGIDGTHTAARLSLTRQFDRTLSGVVEVRHMTGPTIDQRNEFRENAISAALTMLL